MSGRAPNAPPEQHGRGAPFPGQAPQRKLQRPIYVRQGGAARAGGAGYPAGQPMMPGGGPFAPGPQQLAGTMPGMPAMPTGVPSYAQQPAPYAPDPRMYHQPPVYHPSSAPPAPSGPATRPDLTERLQQLAMDNANLLRSVARLNATVRELTARVEFLEDRQADEQRERSASRREEQRRQTNGPPSSGPDVASAPPAALSATSQAVADGVAVSAGPAPEMANAAPVRTMQQERTSVLPANEPASIAMQPMAKSEHTDAEMLQHANDEVSKSTDNRAVEQVGPSSQRANGVGAVVPSQPRSVPLDAEERAPASSWNEHLENSGEEQRTSVIEAHEGMNVVSHAPKKRERLQNLLQQSESLEQLPLRSSIKRASENGGIRSPAFSKSLVFPPTNASVPREPVVPPGRLELAYVYGYRGHDPRCRHNVRVLQSGELVYPAAGVCPVLNAQANTMRCFRRHTDDVTSICSHPDGVHVATGQVARRGSSTAPPIIVWNSSTMTQVLRIDNKEVNVHEGGMFAMEFSRDGSVLASGGGARDDYTLCFFAIGKNFSDAQLLHTTKLRRAIHQIRAGPGSTFAVAAKQLLRWFKPDAKETTAETARFTQGKSKRIPDIYSVCFTPDQHTVAGGSGGKVYVYTRDHNLKLTFVAHEGSTVTAVDTYRSDLVTAAKDNKIKVWHKFTELQKVIQLDDIDVVRSPLAVRALFVHTESECVYVGTSSNELLQVSLSEGTCSVLMQGHFGDLSQRDEVWGLSTHPHEQLAVTCGSDRTIRIWDAESDRLVKTLLAPEKARGVCVSPDGAHLSVGLGSGEVYILSAATLAPISYLKPDHKREEKFEPPTHEMKYSPDGRYFASARERAIDIYDVQNDYKRVWVAQGHSGTVLHFTWSSDSVFLHSNCAAYESLFWNVNDRRSITDPFVFRDITWEPESCVLGWDVQAIWPKDSDGTDVNALCRSFSGSLVATADDFGDVRLFAYPCVVEGGENLSRRYGGHSSHVTNVKFSAGDRYLFSTGGADQCVFKWEVTLAE